MKLVCTPEVSCCEDTGLSAVAVLEVETQSDRPYKVCNSVRGGEHMVSTKDQVKYSLIHTVSRFQGVYELYNN